MQREIVFRAMEKRLNEQAAESGERLDQLLEQISVQAGSYFAGPVPTDRELKRQEAFVRELLCSEEQKNEAQQAMQEELDKLARAMAQLESHKSYSSST